MIQTNNTLNTSSKAETHKNENQQLRSIDNSSRLGKRYTFDSMTECQKFIKNNFGFFMVHLNEFCFVAVFGRAEAEKLDRIAQENFNQISRNCSEDKQYST